MEKAGRPDADYEKVYPEKALKFFLTKQHKPPAGKAINKLPHWSNPETGRPLLFWKA
jgi:hypothetical protein